MKQFLLLLCGMALSGAVQAQKPAPLAIEVGRPREIVLAANPSTGYHWQYAVGDSSVLQVKSRYVASTPARIGSGGEERFTLTGLKKGTSLWVLSYVPPGRNQKASRVMSYIVHVK
ncbi:MAG: protease inhibitor I42 family protein [Siphonobacter aquaeclarae]|nr:protease inhibitor I42 family protein [Siphonobacter aquaeclarae]